MATFPLPEFLAAKVERCRRLLAESEEYRGSSDLQVRRAMGRRPPPLPPPLPRLLAT
jgi:hypothetical protein